MENATLLHTNVAGRPVKKCFIRRITFREAVDITGGEPPQTPQTIINKYRRQN